MKYKIPAFSDWKRALWQKKDLFRWLQQADTQTAPHLLKRKILKTYAAAFNLKVLVETGTYLGDMLMALQKNFEALYSVELDPVLFKKAQRRFAAYPHIKLVQGDSAQVFPELLGRVRQPALFWLDGHYSGEGTARGAQDSPILEELETIIQKFHFPYVLLIDDARHFNGKAGYPTLEALALFVHERLPGWRLRVYWDIIRIHPETGNIPDF